MGEGTSYSLDGDERTQEKITGIFHRVRLRKGRHIQRVDSAQGKPRAR